MPAGSRRTVCIIQRTFTGLAVCGKFKDRMLQCRVLTQYVVNFGCRLIVVSVDVSARGSDEEKWAQRFIKNGHTRTVYTVHLYTASRLSCTRT